MSTFFRGVFFFLTFFFVDVPRTMLARLSMVCRRRDIAGKPGANFGGWRGSVANESMTVILTLRCLDFLALAVLGRARATFEAFVCIWRWRGCRRVILKRIFHDDGGSEGEEKMSKM
jgi:hypothetical protein